MNKQNENIVRQEQSHVWAREEYEHYVEPEWCSRRLFEVEKFTGPIYDPCCGFGNILKSALSKGYKVTPSDIIDRGFPKTTTINFFEIHNSMMCDIVCNPPFNVFREFVERSLAITNGKIAMISLVRTLPAARWLQQTPLSRIWLLTPRPSMPPGHVIARGEKPGGGKQDFCWLVWDKAHVGLPTIGWLHRDGNNESK